MNISPRCFFKSRLVSQKVILELTLKPSEDKTQSPGVQTDVLLQRRSDTEPPFAFYINLHTVDAMELVP